MKSNQPTTIAFLCGVLVLLPGAALAHPAGAQIGGLATGIFHPLTGWDHLAALVAIGAWIGQTQWERPKGPSGVFLAAFAAGGVTGIALGAPAAIESALIASLAALGLLIALAASPERGWGLSGIALFGGIQGLAHGAELQAAAAATAPYVVGLAGTSIALLALGAAAARIAERTSWPILRFSGGLLTASAAGAVALT